jgi:UDP-N-acetylglucosamine 2-epimerase
MKIATIIGARPQFIKAAAVSRAMAEHNLLTPDSSPFTEVIVHTGQHYDEGMSAVFFRELEIPEPIYNLAIGSGSHGRQTGEMLAAIEKVLMAEQPNWVLVYGDTNSTLAGALAAAKLHIPIAHVEAGLRSFNRCMPEEVNRVVTDHLSTILFCPSQVSVSNLAAEGITTHASRFASHVLVVGDVMADALQYAAAKVSTNSDILNRLGVQPQSYLLATVHRAENTDNSDRLENILAAFEAIQETIVFPVHPRTLKFLRSKGYQPTKNVRLIDPVGYFDIIALEKSARIIMTDSGGMQKEAYWLKVPCITLRDETEWVETVEDGWNILTGADRKKIINATYNFTPPKEHPSLYGDGHAAERILEALGVRCKA